MISSPGKTKHIFVSYKRNQIKFVTKLVTNLKNEGIYPWVDRFEIRIGDDWRRAIELAIDGSFAFIAVLSNDYVKSKYCMNELARADSRNIPVYPIVIENIPESRWPISLQRLQYFDFLDWKNKVSFQKKISNFKSELLAQFDKSILNSFDESEIYLTNLLASIEASPGVLEFIELPTQIERNHDLAESYISEFNFSSWNPEFRELIYAKSGEEGNESRRITLYKEKGEFKFDSPESVLNQYQKFVFVGSPGSGKSTALKKLVKIFVDAYREMPVQTPLPLLINLSSWRDDEDLFGFIRRSWPLSSDPFEQLAEGSVILFLDGLNEMGRKKNKKTAMLREWLDRESSPVYFVATCRIDDYNRDLDLGLPIITILEMDESKIIEFARNYLGEIRAEDFLNQITGDYKEVKKANRYEIPYGGLGNAVKVIESASDSQEDLNSFLKLAKNPYLCSALIFIYTSFSDISLLKDHASIIEKTVFLLWARESKKQTGLDVEFDELIKRYSDLAFWMIDKDYPLDIPMSEAKRFLSDSYIELGVNSNLLEMNGESVRFYHQIILEYLASIKIRNIKNLSRVLTTPEFMWPSNINESLAIPMHVRRAPSKWDRIIILAAQGMDSQEFQRFITALAKKDIYFCARVISTVKKLDANQLENISSVLREILCRSKKIFTEHRMDNTVFIDPVIDFQSFTRYRRKDFSNYIFVKNNKSDFYAPAAIALREIKDYKSYDCLFEIAVQEIEVIFPGARKVPVNIGPATEALVSFGAEVVPNLLIKLELEQLDNKKHMPESDSAIFMLGLIGNDAAIPILEKIAYDANYDPNTRVVAIRALVDLGDVGVVKWIVETYYDDTTDYDWRGGLAKILSQSRNPNPELVPYLLQVYEDARGGVRLTDAVTRTLTQIGNLAVPQIIKKIEGLLRWSYDKNFRILDPLTLILWRLSDERSIDVLAKLLRHSNSSIHNKAARALLDIGKSCVPKLYEYLGDKRSWAREAAAHVIGHLGDSSVANDLMNYLRSRKTTLRESAALALEEMGYPAIDVLEVALSAGDLFMRRFAARALGRSNQSGFVFVDPNADRFSVSRAIHTPTFRSFNGGVQALINGLQDQDEMVRRDCAYALGIRRRKEALDPLRKLLNDKNDDVKIEAIRALGKIGDKKIAPELATVVLSEDKPNILIEAVKALEHVGIPKFNQVLLKKFKGIDNDVKLASLKVLVSSGETSIIPELIDQIALMDSEYRAQAIEIVGKLRRREVKEYLLTVLIDDLECNRCREAASFALMDHLTVKDLPVVAQALFDESNMVRARVINGIGRLNHNPAGKYLVGLLSEDNPYIVSEVIDVLGELKYVASIPLLIEKLNDYQLVTGHLDKSLRICDVACRALINIGTTKAKLAAEKWKSGLSS